MSTSAPALEQPKTLPPAEQLPVKPVAEKPAQTEDEQIEAIKQSLTESVKKVEAVNEKIKSLTASTPDSQEKLVAIQKQSDEIVKKIKSAQAALYFGEELESAGLESLKSRATESEKEISQLHEQAATEFTPAAEAAPQPRAEAPLTAEPQKEPAAEVKPKKTTSPESASESPATKQEIEAALDAVTASLDEALEMHGVARTGSKEAQAIGQKIDDIRTEIRDRKDLTPKNLDAAKSAAQKQVKAMKEYLARMDKFPMLPEESAKPEEPMLPAETEYPMLSGEEAQAKPEAPKAEPTAEPETLPSEPKPEDYKMMTPEEQVKLWQRAIARLERNTINDEAIKNANERLNDAKSEWVNLRKINEAEDKADKSANHWISEIVRLHRELGGEAHAQMIFNKLQESFPIDGPSDAGKGAEVRKRNMADLMQLGTDGLAADITKSQKKPGSEKSWLDSLPYINELAIKQREKSQKRDELESAIRSLLDYKDREARINNLETESIPFYTDKLNEAKTSQEFDAKIAGKIHELQQIMLQRFEAWKKLNEFVNGTLDPKAAKALANHPEVAPDDAPLSAGERRIYNEYKARISGLKLEEDSRLEGLKGFMTGGHQDILKQFEEANLPTLPEIKKADESPSQAATDPETQPMPQEDIEQSVKKTKPVNRDEQLDFENNKDTLSDPATWSETVSMAVLPNLVRIRPDLEATPGMSREQKFVAFRAAGGLSKTANEYWQQMRDLRQEVVDSKQPSDFKAVLAKLNDLGKKFLQEISASAKGKAAETSEASKETNQSFHRAAESLRNMTQHQLENQRTSTLIQHKSDLVQNMAVVNDLIAKNISLEDMSGKDEAKLMKAALSMYEALNQAPMKPGSMGRGAKEVKQMAKAMGTNIETYIKPKAAQERKKIIVKPKIKPMLPRSRKAA